jgi:hypothetical protein
MLFKIFEISLQKHYKITLNYLTVQFEMLHILLNLFHNTVICNKFILNCCTPCCLFLNLLTT